MPCTALVVGWLTIFVPAGYTAQPVETDHYDAVFGIPGNTTDEWLTRITGPREALVQVWSGQPPYPGQPAATLSTARITVRDGEAEILRRRLVPNGATFSVAYPRQPGAKGQGLIRVDEADAEAGTALIAAILGGGECGH